MTAEQPPQDSVPQGPPTRPDGSGRPGPRSAAQGLVLGVVAFVATLVLLFGLVSLARQGPGRDAAGRSPAASPVVSRTSPSVAPAGAAPATAGSGPSGSGGVAASAGSGGSPSATTRPSTPPSREAVLVGAGDIADCGLGADTATAALVAGIDGSVFTAGDNAYPSGTSAQFHDCYDPTWGAFRDRTRPAAGNHDWETKGLAGYLGYFGVSAAPNGKSWYSYELGAWHIVVLDSDCSKVGGCGADSPQGRWLASDLKSSISQCTLAIWHHPRFSSGFHGNDAEVAPFWRALYDARADVVINGHDHDYERFAPQDPNGHLDRASGIREFVVGTGGADLRPFVLGRANSELRVSTEHGVIRMALHPGSYEWQFIPTGGAVTDTGSGPCH